MVAQNWPKVSFLIPTLNSEKVLEICLKSVTSQNYSKDKMEIIIADGGSRDSTVEIAKNFGAKIVPNKLVTAEAGKMAALKVATGDLVALVDSDNELPNTDWLVNMVKPLLDNPKAVGSEPWKYTWRPQDGFITRYCALLGMNDPLVLFLGNYDRVSLLTGRWTETPHYETDKGEYLLVDFDHRGMPTIGANGTVFRTDFLKEYSNGEYLFDIDALASALEKSGKIQFVKVKEGIVHSYCESDVKKFSRKQARRVKDFLYHKQVGNRTYPWSRLNYFGYVKFVLSCTTMFPLIVQSLLGYVRKKDTAWFFHTPACLITFWQYGLGVLSSLFTKSEFDRSKWRQ